MARRTKMGVGCKCRCDGGGGTACFPCLNGIPATLHGTFSGPGKPSFEVVMTFTDNCRWDAACAYYPEPDLTFSLNGAPPTGGLGALVYVDDCNSEVLSSFVFGSVREGSCDPFYYNMDVTGFVTLWARGYDTFILTG